ncbi:MAG: PTS glucose transporter subunit IIBC [Gammaproteobacteria bacterium]|nr:MAG: PTS glucose transporter subunit IIBC [Gammaproteobacteria bacterium]TLZ05626.1 MAG: PTS glucose transporter subunit IIBC [Gammaproteobacteria bacterium]TLZ40952.1 MAG: PTS glucose transporter subunit IIBC [Gammaproteobacteria bacterium]
MFKDAFVVLQKIGRSLMIPVAVLPVAGLLLGIGAAHFDWIPPLVSSLMKASGDVVFGNLPLIFAVGVAVGLTENDGIAAISAVVGYVVLLAILGVMAGVWGMEPVTIMGIKSMQTGVFGGILAGAIAATMFKRFYRTTLPPYLAFFSGKRSVPIVTALAAGLAGVVLSAIWPPIQHGIDTFSHWAAVSNPRTAATVYGFVERLLIPFGLHHIWNVPFFFEMGAYTDAGGTVVHGDINRFFAGDPTAGILAGAFLFKMFGLPAAAIAMWHAASPQNRVAVGGIMISAALTSFLTGITEPIEFAFLFVAPVLYVVHALLAASTQFVANTLGMHMGFTFSQGGIDFLVFNVFGKFAQQWWLVLVLGPVYAVIYYVVFRLAIGWLDLKTPGREEAVAAAPGMAPAGGMVPAGSAALAGSAARARDLVLAFGGADNIASLDACITRLRVAVRDPALIDERALTALGASGVMRVGKGVQAVFGPLSEHLKTNMEDYLRASGAAAGAVPAPAPAVRSPASAAAAAPDPALRATAARLLAALGERANVRELEALAHTRLRVSLVDPTRFDEAAAKRAGVAAVMRAAPGVLHLIVGEQAGRLATAMQVA